MTMTIRTGPIEEQLLKAAPDPMIMVDARGTIIQLNTLATTLFGYTQDMLIGQPLDTLIPARLRESHRQHFEQYMQHPTTRPMGFGLELSALHRDGKEFAVEISLSPLRTRNGLRVLVDIRNVTALTQAKKSLEQASVELKRCIDKHNDELLRANAELNQQIVERMRAELEVQKSIRQQTAILNNIPDIAWLKNDESRFIAVNEAFGEACGVEPSALVGRTDLDIWPRQLAESYRADDREVMATAKRKCLEERVVDGTGKERWVETIKTPIYNDEGEIIGTTGIARDITARKQTETALRESKERFRQIAENIREVFYIHDLEQSRMLYISPGYEIIWGRSQASLYADPLSFIDAVHPDDQQRVKRSLDRQARGEATEEVYRIYRPNQTLRWIRDRAFPLHDAAGRIYRVTGIAEDITESKQAEDELYAEKERAQVTLHSIGEAVITTDAQGRVDYLNPVAETLTGWTVAEAKGQFLNSVVEIVAESNRRPVPDLVSRCLQEGEMVGLTADSVFINRFGQEYAIESSAGPIRRRDRSVLGVVVVLRDVTDQRRLAQRLVYDATHDALTGLVNRREFERRLEQALASAKQYQTHHALCYLDLDQFKLVNDTVGHAAGDELLKQIRGLMKHQFRDRDTVARLGGDEFGLLLNHCPLDQAAVIAQTLVSNIRDYRFVWKGRIFQIGASIGITPVTATAEDTDQLLSQADVACYAAKERGRNQVRIYRQEDSEPSQRHGELLRAAKLKQALEQGQFRLYRQPIIPLASDRNRPTRYEVLLRLLDEDNELLLPGTFIPAAERYGLMGMIDRWVIRKAFQRLAEGPGGEYSEIAINVSGNSLNDEAFPAFVQGQFSEFGLPPQRVCFEITETAAIHCLSRATKFMSMLRKQGSHLALDDFGSGLSSFRYLKTFPVNYLKIDGSFVRDMLENHGSCALVTAINQAGHAMNLKTIAEYAQSQAIVERLQELGVDYAQGYALGRPEPWNDSERG